MYCIKCKDNMEKSCKNCGCRICGGKDNEDKQLMCDECNHPYHMMCLTPPLKVMPADDDWLVIRDGSIEILLGNVDCVFDVA